LRKPHRGRHRKTLKKVVDKNMNDIYLKPSDAMDCRKKRDMIRGNWSIGNSDSDAVS